MIEARLVEVTANPKQSYGINWAASSAARTIRKPSNLLEAIRPKHLPTRRSPIPRPDSRQVITTPGKPAQGTVVGGKLQGNDFFFDKALNAIAGQFAILSAPQMSVTLRALNEDSDAEFLANPRIVTADNMQAKIEIIRSQPVASVELQRADRHRGFRRIPGQEVWQHAGGQTVRQ